MQTQEVLLNDASGGLNLDKHPSQLKKNELAASSNVITDEGGWPGKKRPGQQLLQLGPIDPQEHSDDVNTMAHWTMEEATASVALVDTVAAFNADFQGGTAVQVAGIVPAAGFAQAFYREGGAGTPRFARTVPAPGPWAAIQGKAQLTIEGWVKIGATFSGAPIPVSGQTTYQTGAILFGTAGATGGPPYGVTEGVINGVTLHRDWDAVNNADVGDPYVIFTLKTNGISGTVTQVRSGALPIGVWVHVRAVYDGVTASIYLTGRPSATEVVLGGGTVSDVPVVNPATQCFTIGGQHGAAISPFNWAYITGDYEIDDVVVSDVARTSFPFRRLRGNPIPYEKADGSGYIVGAAGDGLFSTILDGTWQVIATGLSADAYWDGKQVNDLLYLTNGIDDPRNWDGTTLRKTGPPESAPTTAVQAIAGPGPGAATYEYAVTFFFGNAETGLGPASTPLAVLVNQGVDITNIPTGNGMVTGRGIYRRRTSDPATAWNLIRVIRDNVTTALNTAWTNNGSPETDTGRDEIPYTSTGISTNYTPIRATVYTSIVPKAAYLATLHRRLFMAGDPDRPYDLIWSEIDAPDVVRVFSYVSSSTSNGPLLGMSNYYNELHVSEGGNSTLVLRGDGPNNWRSLATLHPTLGCVDHFAFVHRTIPGTDRYELCFPAKDGFYRYRGYNFERISENINPLIDVLASFQIRRGAFLTTSQADFQAGPAGVGTATDNIYQPIYGTDGTRQNPDQLGIVDQLQEMPLWRPASPLVTGNIIAQAKGPLEGEFYFSTDASSALYKTTDNFKTVSTVAASPLGASARIIQIVRRGTDDFYFLITDTAGTDYSIGGTVVCKSSGGGLLYTYDAAGAIWNTGVDTLYYDLDVPNSMSGGGTPNLGRAIGRTEQPAPAVSPNNLYVNHSQTVTASAVLSAASAFGWVFNMYNNPSLTGAFGAPVFATGLFVGTTSIPTAVAAGFYSLTAYQAGIGGGDLSSLKFAYTRREYPRWRGGTFSPQAYWDAANNRLIMLASSAEDGNGNRSTDIRTVTSALAVTTYNVGRHVSAFGVYATGILMWTVAAAPDYSVLGRPEVALTAAPGTVISTGAEVYDQIALRLMWNASVGSVDWLGLFKDLDSGRSVQEYYTYTGKIKKIPAATLNPATLQAFTASGDSGIMPVESVYQTTAPYAYYIAVSRQASGAPNIYTADSLLAAISSYNSGLAITSNLLFVPASGATGNYLWADRLYYFQSGTGGAHTQRGIPGVWEVRGSYTSKYYETASIGAFGSFGTQYLGNVQFRMRNGTIGTIAGAAYQGVAPNDNINNFPNPDNVIQWGADFVWQYNYASPTSYPYVNFVQVNYFSDDIQVPRMIGWHWKGRSYWSVARAGSVENDLVLVYQKNDTWATYEAWNVGGICIYRGRLIAPQFYDLVELEKGLTDLGNRIDLLAVTGAIMDDMADKCLRDVNVNQLSFVNPGFPTTNGWCKIVPWGAGVPMTQAEFVAPILATASVAPRQVKAFQPATASGLPFIKAYTRTLQIAYMTSDAPAGDVYEAWYAQPETISAVLVRMFVSNPRYRIASV